MATSFFYFMVILTYAHKTAAQFLPRVPGNAREIGMEPMSFFKNRFLEGNSKELSEALVPKEMTTHFLIDPTTAKTAGGEKFLEALLGLSADPSILDGVLKKCAFEVMNQLLGGGAVFDPPYEFIVWTVVPSQTLLAITFINRGTAPAAYIKFSASRVVTMSRISDNNDLKILILSELYYQMALCFLEDGPPYLMTGIPLYIQNRAGYTPSSWEGDRYVAATSTWYDGEEGTVRFLSYCQRLGMKKAGINFVRELNARMKVGDDHDAHYEDLLHVSAKDLWDNFKESVREL